uniref:Uncharacterized protein n=1 Tax=Romanomermis culicivorax TaxID=13658 RepID=A0A915KB80_ROMCU
MTMLVAKVDWLIARISRAVVVTVADDGRAGKASFSSETENWWARNRLLQLCGIGWMAEILPICSLSILSLEPDAIFGIMGAGLVGVAPKACGLCDVRAISACRSVEVVHVCLVGLRLMTRALLPGLRLMARALLLITLSGFMFLIIVIISLNQLL